MALNPLRMWAAYSQQVTYGTLFGSHFKKAVLELSSLEGCLKLFHQKWRVDNSHISFQGTSYISDVTQISN